MKENLGGHFGGIQKVNKKHVSEAVYHIFINILT